MKILANMCLIVLLLIAAPFFIVFFGAGEVYKLYEEILKNVNKRLDEEED